MKPQIIINQDLGFHNKDLEKSANRITQGGSWKDQSIVWITPSADMIAAKVVWSWLYMIFPPNNRISRVLALGQEVGEAYSNTIEGILADPNFNTYKYILTVEHDNAPEQMAVMKLLNRMEQNKHISAVSALYWTKGEGGVPQIWGDINDPIANYRPQPPIPGNLMGTYGIGMGFALWRMDMFRDKRLSRPLFKTKASSSEGVGTQDLAFCSEAAKYGYKFFVDCDCLCGHYDKENDIMW